MKNLPTLEELHQVAKQYARRAIYDERNMVWIFFDEIGRALLLADEYQFLPKSEKQEVLKSFKQWLNS